MAWTIRNSLNRWCLRSLLEDSSAPLERLIDDRDSISELCLKRCKGLPPLKNSCIAPHCDAWSSIDEERGICMFREHLKGLAEAGKA